MSVGCGSPVKRGAAKPDAAATGGGATSKTAPATPTNSVPRVTAGSDLVGDITSVNTAGRFVVLNFPVGLMPRKGTIMAVHRQGVKIGEVMVTGPQRDTLTAADILKGECAVGDLSLIHI